MKNGVYWIRFKTSIEFDISYNQTMELEKGEETIVTFINNDIYLGCDGLCLNMLKPEDFEVISEDLRQHILIKIKEE